MTNLTVKRSELGGLNVTIKTALADPSYSGSAIFSGTMDDGTTMTISMNIPSETAPASDVIDSGIGARQ